jgi:hypothetical protein
MIPVSARLTPGHDGPAWPKMGRYLAKSNQDLSLRPDA